MIIVNVNINDIKPYKNNPRNNDDAVPLVANSIKEFGFKVPIIIDSNNEIVAGHTRYKAAKELNIDTVPCIVADDLSDEQVKAFRLADNKVAEAAEWDFELLESELDEIIDFDMSDFGFDLIERSKDQETVETIEKNKLTDEFIVPPLSVFDTKQGYWQERKNMWKNIGIKSELGRNAECIQPTIGGGVW